MRKTAALALAIVLAAASLAAQRGSAVTADAKAAAFAKPAADNMTLTAVEGVKVGSVTLSGRPTGCTAILFKEGTTGSVDVGGGATGGKSGGGGRAGPSTGSGQAAGGGPMKAGIGSAAIKLPNGLVVAALVAVNAVGDIIDPWTGQVVAGARGADGKLSDAR